MRRYLLDSTPLAAYLLGRTAARRLIGPWIRARECATSILVYAEVTEYLRGRSDFAQLHRALRALLSDAVHPYVLPFAVLDRYGVLRRELRPPHGPGLIGDIDTFIAATALERGLSLVTTDGDFDRVPGLDVVHVTL